MGEVSLFENGQEKLCNTSFLEKEYGAKFVEVKGHQYMDVKTGLLLAYVLNEVYDEMNSYKKAFDRMCSKARKMYIKSGYCYIGHDENWQGFYKIGRTKDESCKTRLNRTINPNYKILYRTCFLDDSYKIESEIHRFLKRNNIDTKNGCKEWFCLDDNMLRVIVEKYNFEKL
ncbi:MAG: GIY-YIG nuclease family protein [Treponema sp.]|nr:GIY-YIG nuclease family protein [Treponema sp.]